MTLCLTGTKGLLNALFSILYFTSLWEHKGLPYSQLNEIPVRAVDHYTTVMKLNWYVINVNLGILSYFADIGFLD